jgi:hypothetical protein
VQIISTRCRTFEYTVTAQGPCAVDMEWGIGVRKCFRDCLRVSVGVRHGELTLAGAAVQTVLRIAGETDAREVVIDGVAHVPGDRPGVTAAVDVLSALADTLDVLVEMTERLEQRGERVHLMPFGWHKECHTEAVVGPGARQIIRLPVDGDVPVHPRFRGMRPVFDRRRRGRCVTG